MEIFGRVSESSGGFYLMLDIKNGSDNIHEILGIQINDKNAGLEITTKALKETLNQKIQKNEICMLELKLY